MYLGVDIGGTKTLLAVFDTKGRLVEQHKFPTPHDYNDFVNELTTSVQKLKKHDFKATGVAIPGKVDRKHGVGIAFGNLPWQDTPIQADCEQILNCPVVVENDANLAGLSEAILIKKEYRNVLYVTISTGIGGGFITNGKLDSHFLDAEVGQILLEHNGEFKRWEDFASGRAIVEHFGKKASDITSAQDWYVIARNIAVGLINLIAVLTPDAIIIGGGVGTHFSKYKDRLVEQLKLYDNPLITLPPILPAQRPEDAVVYGCYELAKATYGKK